MRQMQHLARDRTEREPGDRAESARTKDDCVARKLVGQCHHLLRHVADARVHTARDVGSLEDVVRRAHRLVRQRRQMRANRLRLHAARLPGDRFRFDIDQMNLDRTVLLDKIDGKKYGMIRMLRTIHCDQQFAHVVLLSPDWALLQNKLRTATATHSLSI